MLVRSGLARYRSHFRGVWTLHSSKISRQVTACLVGIELTPEVGGSAAKHRLTPGGHGSPDPGGVVGLRSAKARPNRMRVRWPGASRLRRPNLSEGVSLAPEVRGFPV